jgi:hypothetical protein
VREPSVWRFLIRARAVGFDVQTAAAVRVVFCDMTLRTLIDSDVSGNLCPHSAGKLRITG